MNGSSTLLPYKPQSRVSLHGKVKPLFRCADCPWACALTQDAASSGQSAIRRTSAGRTVTTPCRSTARRWQRRPTVTGAPARPQADRSQRRSERVVRLMTRRSPSRAGVCVSQCPDREASDHVKVKRTTLIWSKESAHNHRKADIPASRHASRRECASQGREPIPSGPESEASAGYTGSRLTG